MTHATETLDLEWTVSASTTRLEAQCLLCVHSAEASVTNTGVFPRDPKREPDLRASLTRTVLAELRAKGCAHAMLDRAALTDCIMRPNRAGYDMALAILLECNVEDVQSILRERTTQIYWEPGELRLSWRQGALGELSEKFIHSVRDERLQIVCEIAPEEYWEQLVARGLVPVRWLEDSSRGFRTNVPQDIAPPVVAENRRWRTAAPNPVEKRVIVDERRSVPHTLRDCVALATDRAGLELAETLVREVIERLTPWGITEISNISWRPVDASTWRTVRRSWWSQSLQWTVATALEASALKLPLGHGPKDPAGRPSWWSLAANESSLSQLWDQLSAMHVVREDPVAKVNRAFESLLNPYEPLLAIWATGYVLDEFRDGEAILVAPYV